MQTTPMQMSDEAYESLRHSFSWALEKIKQGKKVTRDKFKEWMYVFMVVNDWRYNSEYEIKDNEMALGKTYIHPHIMMIKDWIWFPLDLSCESIFWEDWYEYKE